MTIQDMTGAKRKPALKDAVIHKLLAEQERNGYVTNKSVRAAATTLGVTPRSIRRCLKQARLIADGELPPPVHDAWVPDETFMAVFHTMNGDAKATLNALATLGAPVGVSLRTVQRALSRRCDAALTTAVREGEVQGVVPVLDRTHILHRNQTWAIDHAQLPVWVRIGNEATKPWLTTVEDEATRMLMGWTVSAGSPTTETVIATLLRSASGYDVEGEFVGGKPDTVHSDCGSDLVNDAVMNLAEVGVLRTTTNPYSAWQNGRVERWHGELKRQVLPKYPGYHHEKRLTAAERREHSRSTSKGICPLPVGDLLTLEEFQAALWVDMRAHNQERGHTSLDGKTPMEAWLADTTELERVDEVAFRAAATKRKRAVVRKGRVRMSNRFYMSTDADPRDRGILSTWEGLTVEVRFVPKAEDVGVWIYDPETGRHLCDAFPMEQRTQADVAATKQSEARLTQAFTAGRDDAVRIRKLLHERTMEKFEHLTGDHLPISTRKARATTRDQSHDRSARQQKKLRLLEGALAESAVRDNTTADGAAPVQGPAVEGGAGA